MTVSAKGARRHSSRACDWRSLEGRKGSWLAAPAFVEGRSDHARSVTQNAGPRDKTNERDQHDHRHRGGRWTSPKISLIGSALNTSPSPRRSRAAATPEAGFGAVDRQA